MKALCWYGTEDIRVETVPDPTIRDARDAIVRITATAICGSDLHLYGGYMPTMEQGDILGHEPMGEVVEVGSAITTLRPGDRVVVPFTIACGTCFFCQQGLFSLCDTSNPNAEVARKAMGHSPAGLFGFSHMLGGFPGGQAEYSASRLPMSAPSKSRRAYVMSKCCSCPTSSPRATWRRRMPTLPPATPWLSGGADPSRNSLSRVPGCSVPGG